MIHKTIPSVFNAAFEVVSCYVEHDQMALLLFRNSNKAQGERWGVPAGKVQPGESLVEAMVRELAEETGILVEASALHYLEPLCIEHAPSRFLYHTFYLRLNSRPSITVNPNEHRSHKWVALNQSASLKLVEDLHECILRYLAVRHLIN